MSTTNDRLMNRAVGRAIARYDMIEDGDRLAVGVSGGADSLALWRMLDERRRRAPVSYRVVGIHIDLGFGAGTGEALAAFAARQGYELHVETTDIGPTAHGEDNEENPCFLCARLRRKRLFELTVELGCTKLCLGHNQDDIIETALMNMCYIGEVSTMVPRQAFFGGEIVVVRPLAFADKPTIGRYARDHALPVMSSGCPTDGESRRSSIRTMLGELYRSNKKIRSNLFRSLHRDRINLDYLLR